jgi:hypothetical protein
VPYELQDGAPRLLARYGQHRDEAREQDACEVNPGEYLKWPQSLDEIKLAKEQDAVLRITASTIGSAASEGGRTK